MVRPTAEERLDRMERAAIMRKLEGAIESVSRRARHNTDLEEGGVPPGANQLPSIFHDWLLQLERRTIELEHTAQDLQRRSIRWRWCFIVSIGLAIGFAIAPWVQLASHQLRQALGLRPLWEIPALSSRGEAPTVPSPIPPQ
jgi:hypothetical protein